MIFCSLSKKGTSNNTCIRQTLLLHHGTTLREFLAKRMKNVVRKDGDIQSHKEGVLSLTAPPLPPSWYDYREEKYSRESERDTVSLNAKAIFVLSQFWFTGLHTFVHLLDM